METRDEGDRDAVAVPPVVSDSSVLIALTQIGHLGLLRQLFRRIIIPDAVSRETQRSVPPEDWIARVSLQQEISPPILQTSLGDGESDAIRLALEIRARLVLLDDLPARRFAESLGFL
jgi:predicted nucleic acid-binding protein